MRYALVAGAVPAVALRPALVASALQLEQEARRDGGVGEVGEHAVDSEAVELQILVDGVAGVVRKQAPLLVAERPGVDEESDFVGALDQVRRRERAAARLSGGGRA